jgi:hypothetical protein
MKTRSILLAVAISAAALLGLSWGARVAFRSPATCNSCHFIEPYYKKWQTSSHNMVPCLKCHDYSPERALAGQFLFLAGAYNPRPLTRVPDANCMQGGCHDKRLAQAQVTLAKRGIAFDHSRHFGQERLGIKLHCRNCHSDIVQGEHLKVSLNVCYLCHFKGQPHDQARTGCPSCHSAPVKPVSYQGRGFDHAASLKAGHRCGECHVEITRGDGITPRDKCFFCHVDRAERYGEVNLIHARHVGEKQIDCLYCHPRIEHGKIKMADKMPL